MTPCTWTPDCPRPGDHRMENTSLRGGGVEFVCDRHVASASDNSYAPIATDRDRECRPPW